ncbi:TPA: VRR-NUC domain-containing protein [Pseudomonas aeruginosa]|uniref:VRR-NUC domain-containing protein n=1 Tax=Pseudomonas TaxID=286 RepID=UPI00071C0B88|nr:MULTISPECIES: VRR-NUC domain-containing protein [Pseudomonas]EKV4827938.1 VRR-NUC domain-containing protein [Pseudomonas aeruginosa]ELN5418343.1 VRR-NUC domain-containing protein [Pseudomonas aeruginosa]KSH17765.1 VRR-NUC domain-containing protein [Pseudomonas aeruginosa]MBG7209545.1 VRR-NUC domain-containing protein [Pseudomonas aeruginosa]MBH3656008.1 VRR-NUC domain-containing protein [Pseudomonas aeruginosa]
MNEYEFPNELEADVERPAKEFAKKRGWFVVKLMRCDIDSMPDDLFHRRGVTMYIEFKRPGEQPSKKQRSRHRELRAHGIPVHVCDNLDTAYDLLA